MSKASKRLAVAAALAVAAMATHAFLPAPARAEIATVPEHALPQPAARTAQRYQIRCWQQGRLIFDEHGIALPKDLSIDAATLRGRDAQQRHVYVIETSNATCFVRPSDQTSHRFGAPTVPFTPLR